MIEKDKNGVYHYIQNEERLFVRNWWRNGRWGVKLVIGLYHQETFENILFKLAELEPFFSPRENRLIEDMKREYLNRIDDDDCFYSKNDVEQIIERFKSGV